jgi:hypothetical protein
VGIIVWSYRLLILSELAGIFREIGLSEVHKPNHDHNENYEQIQGRQFSKPQLIALVDGAGTLQFVSLGYQYPFVDLIGSRDPWPGKDSTSPSKPSFRVYRRRSGNVDPEITTQYTQCEDETLSDRQHRTIRNRETRFSPVGTSRLLGQMASCCSRKTGLSVTARPWPAHGGHCEKDTNEGCCCRG